MSYTTQLITESVQGKHNIAKWVQEEIASIDSEDMEAVTARARLFLSQQREDLEEYARLQEIVTDYGLDDAVDLMVSALLEAIILIKPDLVIRAGREVAFAGVSPIQAVASMIGLQLHKDRVDAVSTGINILAEFHDLGIYDVRIVAEADRAVNRGGHIEVHGDSAVIVPLMDISVELYKRIQFTRYLPPMLVQPALI
jgi:hypothetical protein